MDTVLRLVVLALTSTGVVLMLALNVPKVRRHQLTRGEALARMGFTLLLASVWYATLDFLIDGGDPTVRLIVLCVGLIWVTAGVALCIHDERRTR